MMSRKTILFIALLSITSAFFAQVSYQNDSYGFEAQVPEDWHVYAEIKDDQANKVALINWGLPKVYSELENASIENAVSVVAYKRSNIKNTDDLINLELERTKDILESKERIQSSSNVAYIMTAVINGLTYKSKVTFVFKNDIGYVITFTATPGTYDMNLGKYDDFRKELTFFVPKETKKSTSTNLVRYDGLYVAKTGVIKIPDNKMDIYTYIRFYEDGTVYTQAVTGYAPEKVITWLGKEGRFERKGNFVLKGAEINFTVTNDESSDRLLEGARTDEYRGKITDENKLFLMVELNGGETKDVWFEFVTAH